MSEQPKQQFSTYDVRCGDNTEGRLSAASPQEAREMAEEMCQVHGGVQSDPQSRAKR